MPEEQGTVIRGKEAQEGRSSGEQPLPADSVSAAEGADPIAAQTRAGSVASGELPQDNFEEYRLPYQQLTGEEEWVTAEEEWAEWSLAHTELPPDKFEDEGPL